MNVKLSLGEVNPEMIHDNIIQQESDLHSSSRPRNQAAQNKTAPQIPYSRSAAKAAVASSLEQVQSQGSHKPTATATMIGQSQWQSHAYEAPPLAEGPEGSGNAKHCWKAPEVEVQEAEQPKVPAA